MQINVRLIIIELHMFDEVVEATDCWGTRVPHLVGDAGKNIIAVRRL